MKNKKQYFITVFRPSRRGENRCSQVKCLHVNADNEDFAVESKTVQKVVNTMYGKEIRVHVEHTEKNGAPTGCLPYTYIITKSKAVLS